MRIFARGAVGGVGLARGRVVRGGRLRSLPGDWLRVGGGWVSVGGVPSGQRLGERVKLVALVFEQTSRTCSRVRVPSQNRKLSLGGMVSR